MINLKDQTLCRILDFSRVGKTTCVKKTAADLCVQNVRTLVESRAILYRDFADRCGMSDVSLSYIFNGRRPVSLERLLSFGKALGISPLDDLWLPRAEFTRKYCRQ